MTGFVNQTILEQLKKLFLDKLGEDLISLILFGSRARDEGSVGSDVDLFLIARTLPHHPFERQLYMRNLIPLGFPSQISVYPKTAEEFERDFPAIYLDLAKDGVIIHDTNHYAFYRLQKIREIIKEAGLKRVKKSGQFLWTWEKQPAPGWRIDWSGLNGFERRS